MRTGLPAPCRARVGWRRKGIYLFLQLGESPCPPLARGCPPGARAPPSSVGTTHSGQARLWQLSVLVIIPWEQACFLFQGRLGGGRGEGRLRGADTGDGSAPPNDGMRMCPPDISLIQHKAAFTPQPVCPGSNTQVLGKGKGGGGGQNCLTPPRKVSRFSLTCLEQ